MPGIWFLFSCLFSYIFKCPQVYFLKNPHFSWSNDSPRILAQVQSCSGKTGSGDRAGHTELTLQAACLGGSLARKTSSRSQCGPRQSPRGDRHTLPLPSAATHGAGRANRLGLRGHPRPGARRNLISTTITKKINVGLLLLQYTKSRDQNLSDGSWC